MNKKIRFSELFARAWAMMRERYGALLPIILKVILPVNLLSTVVLLLNMNNVNQLSALTTYGMMPYVNPVVSLLLSLFSFLLMMVSIFVVIPATYGMYITMLYPGVDGNGGLKNAFKMYGKALGNILFSYLPVFITIIVLGIIMGLVVMMPVVMFFAFNITGYGTDGILAIMFGVYGLMVLVMLIGASIAYGYTAQMIPISIVENVPITRTFSLSNKRGAGAILSCASIYFIYMLCFFVLGGSASVLIGISSIGYNVIICLSQLASPFLAPFPVALNAAMYRLCKERDEAAAAPRIESNNNPLQ